MIYDIPSIRRARHNINQGEATKPASRTLFVVVFFSFFVFIIRKTETVRWCGRRTPNARNCIRKSGPVIADGKLSGDLGARYRPRGGLVLISHLFLCCLYGTFRSSSARTGDFVRLSSAEGLPVTILTTGNWRKAVLF